MFNIALLASCPTATALTAATLTTCKQRVGQINKIALQRTLDGATENVITIATSNPNVLATWTALQAATDGTKVVRMPIVEDPNIEIGDVREAGGGNATLGGIPKNLGLNSTKFSFKIYDADQSLIETYRSYEKEKLSVFFANDDGEVIGVADDLGTPTTFKGISIHNFAISDRQIGGFEEADYHMITFYARAKWSDKLYFVTPTDFDPIVSL